VEWRCFLAAAEEAEEEWRQLEAADQDVQQWVQEVEQQAAAGEAEIVEEMVEAATEAAEKGAAGVEIEAAEVVVLGAAVEPVVWDTGEAVAEAEAEGEAASEAKAEELEAMADAEAVEMQVKAAEVEDGAAVEDQNKIFDPGGAAV
jgi:hypothetical protein